jgi:Zn-dependent M16 (insulinase) family peptidase
MTLTHGFELVRDETIAELNTRGRLYRHAATGAEVLSLENDDENKVFGITFRTPPNDSTGVAHILEHSVLCGSRKYPVKEPFVELLKSSVKTFLNAFTFPDKTCYPVASTNLQDFYNLIDVYLDAVLHPRITPEILQQEGWHYELEQVGAPLQYKGVVFNEMKGAYSSPDSMLYRYSQQSLFPDTTYGVSSGGDPRFIPDLTYADFKRFHETLYHPSNARVFFYGDDPPEERLRLIDAAFSAFSRIDPASQIARQDRFAEPQTYEHTYSVSEPLNGQAKGLVNVNWMIGTIDEMQEVLALDILTQILLGTAAAPLRKALIDSGLGEDVTGSGYNEGTLQHTFAVGMKGIDPANAAQVEQLILQTLERLATEGIAAETIAAALNTVEFSLRENNTGSFPRGLNLMLRALSTWLYDRDPFASLYFETPLAAIKAALERGDRLFEQLIRRYLLDNPHRTRVLLRPDPAQAERDAAEERARLDAVQAGLSDAELEALVASTEALRRMQAEPDDPAALARIPSLRLADLERQGKTIPSELRDLGGVPLLSHDLSTNGIAYFDLGFDLRTVPLDLLPLVPLFARTLTEMGTNREDFVKLIQRIGRDTGGIGATLLTSTQVESGAAFGRMIIRGKATLAQTGALLDILRDILLELRLDDRERFRQILLRARAGREASLTPSGHVLARRRLAARLDPAAWVDEQTGGIANLFFLRELEQAVDQDWPGVLEQLERLRSTLINRNALIANLTLADSDVRTVEPQLREFVAALPSAEWTPNEWTRLPSGVGEGLTIPARVNYVARGASLAALGVKPGGSASVITRFLNTAYLWDRVRVQGGAYGCFAQYDRSAGTFLYASYRDPNLLRTLDVYDGAGAFLRQLALEPATVERSVIGTIGEIDAYRLPDARGYTALVRHLAGVDDAYRQRIRDEVFATSAADFRAFADVLDAVRDNAQTAVLGSEEAINEANAQRPGLLTLARVL